MTWAQVGYVFAMNHRHPRMIAPARCSMFVLPGFTDSELATPFSPNGANLLKYLGQARERAASSISEASASGQMETHSKQD